MQIEIMPWAYAHNGPALRITVDDSGAYAEVRPVGSDEWFLMAEMVHGPGEWQPAPCNTSDADLWMDAAQWFLTDWNETDCEPPDNWHPWFLAWLEDDGDMYLCEAIELAEERGATGWTL